MPTVFTVHHNIDFTPANTKDYFLSVLVGNGQSGSTTFRNPAGDFISPDVFNVPLGRGKQLKGTSLPVVSVVMDINPQTDNMVVSYYITDTEVLDEEELKTLEPTDIVPFAADANQTITFFTSLNFQ